jgi:hypothetical protein
MLISRGGSIGVIEVDDDFSVSCVSGFLQMFVGWGFLF